MISPSKDKITTITCIFLQYIVDYIVILYSIFFLFSITVCYVMVPNLGRRIQMNPQEALGESASTST